MGQNYLIKLFRQTYFYMFFPSQNMFLVKHITLTFSLVQTAFSSIYKDILTILV